MKNFSKKLIIAQISLVFCALSLSTMAAENEKVRLGLDASMIEIYQALTGQATRSIVMLPQNETEAAIENASAGTNVEEIDTASTLSEVTPVPKNESAETASLKSGIRVLESPVRFEYDSADLTEDSIKFIHKIGEVFKYESEKGGVKRILVTGHTDSRGTDEYNKVLSEKRAEAVKDYLRRAFYFKSSDIKVEGFGEDELAYLPATAAENRRVEFAFEY